MICKIKNDLRHIYCSLSEYFLVSLSDKKYNIVIILTSKEQWVLTVDLHVGSSPASGSLALLRSRLRHTDLFDTEDSQKPHIQRKNSSHYSIGY